MWKSYPIRFAVNLCLATALLLSPGTVGPAYASECNKDASNKTLCSGCGKCSVADHGGRCGCCSNKQRQPVVNHEAEKSCCRKAAKGEDKESTPVASCLCGKAPQPATPGSQNRVPIEQLVKLSAKGVAPFSRFDEDPAFLAGVLLSPHGTIPPRASQRLLCVWLI